jgi:uncharacterized protein YbjT (DUF2867 family)
VWLSPAFGIRSSEGESDHLSDQGTNKTSWISYRDVARCAVAAVEQSRAANATIELGGPDALSPLEVVRAAEEVVGKPVVVQHVPEEVPQVAT